MKLVTWAAIAAALGVGVFGDLAAAQGRGAADEKGPPPPLPTPVGGSDQYRFATPAQIAIADEAEKVSASNRLLSSSVASNLVRPVPRLPACQPGDLVVVMKFSGMLAFAKSGDAEEAATLTIHKVGAPGDFGSVTLARPILGSEQRMKGVRAHMTVRAVDAAGRSAGVDPTKTPEVILCG